MNTTSLRLITLLPLTLLGACSTTTPQLDSQFGLSVTQARQAQIITPAPPATLLVNGVDGNAAKSAYNAYLKSYQDPQPQSGALAIGVGR